MGPPPGGAMRTRATLLLSAAGASAGLVCHWAEHSKTYISCHAAGDGAVADLTDRKHRCEELGADCVGVTCANFAEDCTVRNHQGTGCEDGKFLQPSEPGEDGKYETSYTKDCDFTPMPPQSSCSALKDVKETCTADGRGTGSQPCRCSNDGCKVLVTNMRGKSCTEYCKENGMSCSSAWEEQEDTCVVKEAWLCDQPYLDSSRAQGVWTSDLICECVAAPAPNAPPTPPPTRPPPPPASEMPACLWTEHPNAYISCLADGETTEGNMLQMQKKCEDMGDRCAGVTCEEMFVKCTVRHHEHCDANQYLAPSESGETSYTKDCTQQSNEIGTCDKLPDQVKQCGSNGCKVLATNMRGKTCTSYCRRQNLRCVGAWEEQDNTCSVAEVWLCDQPYLDTSKGAAGHVWTSDLICECMPPAVHATPRPPPPSPPLDPAQQPTCKWTEHENSYISCHATGETREGDLLERQKRCEELGDQCSGVTCEELFTKCTVRHQDACDMNEFLAPSELGETSYTKDCAAVGQSGTCAGMSDVKKKCSPEGCKVLATNMRGKTCSAYCKQNGLVCVSAAEETNDDCNVHQVWLCDQPFLDSSKAGGTWTSDLICECAPQLTPRPGVPSTPLPPAPSPPLDPNEQTKCKWTEHPNAYISCHANGESDEGDLLEREKRCETLGDDCAGVTCEELYTKCTVRHHQQCEDHQFLAPSEGGETSYTKDCTSSVTGGSCAALPDVKKKCSTDGCKVLATNMRGGTCTSYCKQQGLACISAAEEKNDDCQIAEVWLCDQPYLDSSKGGGVWTSDLICECKELVGHSTPRPPPPSPPLNPADQPTCRWKEHENAYISCHATGETIEGDLLERQKRCEALGRDCTGVTCEELFTKCTVRHQDACDQHGYLQPSEMGETSYTKDCQPVLDRSGRCTALKDVKMSCSPDNCKVLATNMRGRTCGRYCKENGLTCVGAWEEEHDDCGVKEVWLCDKPYLDSSRASGTWTSDLICQCAETKAVQEDKQEQKAHPTPRTQIPPALMPKCHWNEHSNSFISCLAAGETVQGDLISRKKRCEELGPAQCAGVTCEEIDQKCSVRHHEQCDDGKYLAPSPTGETSYTIDQAAPGCGGGGAKATGKGHCSDLKDVKQTCSRDGCKVLATNMRGVSCGSYCGRYGLKCVNAWEDRDDSCEVYDSASCDQPYTGSSHPGAQVMTSDLICQCEESLSASATPPAPQGGGDGGKKSGGTSILVPILLVSLAVAVAFVIYRNRAQVGSFGGGIGGGGGGGPRFRPVRQEAFDDDDAGGDLFGEDAQEKEEDGNMRLPPPPKEARGAEV